MSLSLDVLSNCFSQLGGRYTALMPYGLIYIMNLICYASATQIFLNVDVSWYETLTSAVAFSFHKTAPFQPSNTVEYIGYTINLRFRYGRQFSDKVLAAGYSVNVYQSLPQNKKYLYKLHHRMSNTAIKSKIPQRYPPRYPLYDCIRPLYWTIGEGIDNLSSQLHVSNTGKCLKKLCTKYSFLKTYTSYLSTLAPVELFAALKMYRSTYKSVSKKCR